MFIYRFVFFILNGSLLFGIYCLLLLIFGKILIKYEIILREFVCYLKFCNDKNYWIKMENFFDVIFL